MLEIGNRARERLDDIRRNGLAPVSARSEKGFAHRVYHIAILNTIHPISRCFDPLSVFECEMRPPSAHLHYHSIIHCRSITDALLCLRTRGRGSCAVRAHSAFDVDAAEHVSVPIFSHGNPSFVVDEIQIIILNHTLQVALLYKYYPKNRETLKYKILVANTTFRRGCEEFITETLIQERGDKEGPMLVGIVGRVTPFVTDNSNPARALC